MPRGCTVCRANLLLLLRSSRDDLVSEQKLQFEASQCQCFAQGQLTPAILASSQT